MMLATDHQMPARFLPNPKILIDTFTSMSGVAEKRLLIEISILRDAFGSGEVYKIGCVSSECYLADALTKKKKCNFMEELHAIGKLQNPVNEGIAHPRRQGD